MKKLKEVIQKLINCFLNRRDRGEVHYINGYEILPAPLKKDEEREIFERIEAGDESAREPLIVHNLRLVVYIARKFENSGVGIEDLISIGTIGLIKAVNTFRPSKNIKLATYASRCIENEILMLLRANKKFKNNVSLSEVVGTDKDGNELMLIDLLCEKDDSVFQKVEKAIQNEKFTELVRAVLTEREFKIITLRYGLKGGRCHPQREVALLMRISRSYVSRIEKKAVEKLKAAVKKEDFYL